MKRVGVAFLSSLSLMGCSQGDQRVCSTPPPLEVAHQELIASRGVAQVIAARKAADACLHRWSYRLAASPDPAPVVADAVVAGCDDAPAYNLYARARLLQESNMVFDGGSIEAERARLRALALFHVVQARAGKCAVPG